LLQNKLETQRKYDNRVKDDPELLQKKLETQRIYDNKVKDDPELLQRKKETQRIYDNKVKDDPELLQNKLETKRKHDNKVKDDPELLQRKIETQRIYDNKVKDDPELLQKKRETQNKYDNKVKDTKTAAKRSFNATKKAIQDETGLTILCLVCNKLKCPDSVKTYANSDEVPLQYKVLMEASYGAPSVCYYCKQLVRKGKIPKTNRVSNCLQENRFINDKKLEHIVDQVIEEFSYSIV
jgi:hypothetical protein